MVLLMTITYTAALVSSRSQPCIGCNLLTSRRLSLSHLERQKRLVLQRINRGGGRGGKNLHSSVIANDGENNLVFSRILNVFGKLAPFVSIILFGASIPTILNVMKEKTVGNLPLLPYSSL